MTKKPVRVYGVKDVASAWNLSPERVRQLIRARIVIPDIVHLAGTNYIMSFWYDIPERSNGLEDMIRQFLEEDG